MRDNNSKDNRLQDKVCLVTGVTSGIGKIAARELARQGARVGLVARDEKRGQAIRTEILAEVGADARVDLFTGDLASLKSLEALVESVKSKYERLDVLLNNAGIYKNERTLTVDGLETQFAVNYLAPYYLNTRLKELLKKSASARIINVSSRMHKKGSLDFENLQMEKNYSAFRAYANTKLALITHTVHLADTMQNEQVSVNAVHPGVIATGISRELPQPIRYLWNLFLKTPEQGARPLIYLAGDPSLAGKSGLYFNKVTQDEPHPVCHDKEKQERLSRLSEEIIAAKR